MGYSFTNSNLDLKSYQLIFIFFIILSKENEDEKPSTGAIIFIIVIGFFFVFGIISGYALYKIDAL